MRGTLAALLLLVPACADPRDEPTPVEQETTPRTDDIGARDTSPAADTSEDTSADSSLPRDGAEGPEPDPNPGPEFPPALESDLLAILVQDLDELAAPGATLTIVIPGHRRFETAIGKGRDEPLTEMVVGDRLRTGSVTKTFITAATLQLVEEGLVGLDDPIDLWVTDYSMGAGVTVRRLLNHTSGIPNYTDDPGFLSKVFGHGEPQDVIDFALEMGILFAPGDGFTYSNTNFYFLGLMLEAVTGKPVHEVLRERLFEAYALGDTFFEGAEPIEGTYIEGYLAGAPAPLTDMSWAWAAGAVVSDGSDLCAWLQVLYRGDAISPEHQTFMMTRTSLWGGTTLVDYGAGTEVHTQGGRDVFGHTGSTVGGQCEIYFEPESEVCVALMVNDFFATIKPTNTALWSRVLEHVDVQ
jgi:D-alanyl-D-alanine carboxypeptidase